MALIRKLDRIFSKIMHRKMFKCERCGKKGAMKAFPIWCRFDDIKWE